PGQFGDIKLPGRAVLAVGCIEAALLSPEAAAAVGAEQAGGEGDLGAARLDLLVGALVAGRPDAPLAVDLDVGVLVEGSAPDVDAELELGDGVGKRPYAGGRVGP